MFFSIEEEKDLSWQKYFVLYKRDDRSTKKPSYNGVELYDRIKYFSDEEAAKNFALSKLPCKVAKKYNINSEETNLDYIVAGEFNGKYTHTDYTGDRDYLKTYDAVKCGKSEIESIINSFAKEEYFQGVEIGIELKLF